MNANMMFIEIHHKSSERWSRNKRNQYTEMCVRANVMQKYCIGGSLQESKIL